ncbi:hypothetical protein [Crateriforma conspicua]|uniref:hypothetical protein n=1 Tax=Crateriforma conspicua TaxID=2527996 RepID=UPI001187BD65|nr:hypothetical protein [Crateriforma conspicua]QDV65158.1 hypothetical protein Mal65_43280 [Crateriforma conspicua]
MTGLLGALCVIFPLIADTAVGPESPRVAGALVQAPPSGQPIVGSRTPSIKREATNEAKFASAAFSPYADSVIEPPGIQKTARTPLALSNLLPSAGGTASGISPGVVRSGHSPPISIVSDGPDCGKPTDAWIAIFLIPPTGFEMQAILSWDLLLTPSTDTLSTHGNDSSHGCEPLSLSGHIDIHYKLVRVHSPKVATSIASLALTGLGVIVLASRNRRLQYYKLKRRHPS